MSDPTTGPHSTERHPVGASPRLLYCVLSSRSLPYATEAFRSLFQGCEDDFRLTLITDGVDDKLALESSMRTLSARSSQTWSVRSKKEADVIAYDRLSSFPAIAAFRDGHPCWRKITDPMLFARDGEEMILLDPDLYFPNRFRFEPTPQRGLLLMHQPPSCLLPHEVVARAFDLDVPMAHHTDIGVAQIRAPLDLEWLDRLIQTLGGTQLPRSMHVESIVWAAMAMHVGGGYLDGEHWHCWRNAQWKRLALKIGVSGSRLLSVERFGTMKCFHGGGAAKWWIADAVRRDFIPKSSAIGSGRRPVAYTRLTRTEYDAMRRWKELARRVGYYRLMKN